MKNQVTGNFLLNAKSDEAESKSFIDGGLQWEYSNDEGKETLRTSGPLHEGIVVLVSDPRSTFIAGIYLILFHGDVQKPTFSVSSRLKRVHSHPVQILPQEEEAKISLTYKYIIHEDLLPLITNNNVLLAELDTYEWALKSWSQCSKPCGGGRSNPPHPPHPCSVCCCCCCCFEPW